MSICPVRTGPRFIAPCLLTYACRSRVSSIEPLSTQLDVKCGWRLVQGSSHAEANDVPSDEEAASSSDGQGSSYFSGEVLARVSSSPSPDNQLQDRVRPSPQLMR